MPPALLLDVDGVLHVGDAALPGAVAALAELRELGGGLRLVTNTTSKPRRLLLGQLRELGFAVAPEAVVVGKPSARFFGAALADLGAAPSATVMVGDDVEADVGGALAAGLAGVLVRTGKYREELVAASGVTPTATLDSIAELPAWLAAQASR